MATYSLTQDGDKIQVVDIDAPGDGRAVLSYNNGKIKKSKNADKELPDVLKEIIRDNVDGQGEALADAIQAMEEGRDTGEPPQEFIVSFIEGLTSPHRDPPATTDELACAAILIDTVQNNKQYRKYFQDFQDQFGRIQAQESTVITQLDTSLYAYDSFSVAMDGRKPKITNVTKGEDVCNVTKVGKLSKGYVNAIIADVFGDSDIEAEKDIQGAFEALLRGEEFKGKTAQRFLSDYVRNASSPDHYPRPTVNDLAKLELITEIALNHRDFKGRFQGFDDERGVLQAHSEEVSREIGERASYLDERTNIGIVVQDGKPILRKYGGKGDPNKGFDASKLSKENMALAMETLFGTATIMVDDKKIPVLDAIYALQDPDRFPGNKHPAELLLDYAESQAGKSSGAARGAFLADALANHESFRKKVPEELSERANRVKGELLEDFDKSYDQEQKQKSERSKERRATRKKVKKDPNKAFDLNVEVDAWAQTLEDFPSSAKAAAELERERTKLVSFQEKYPDDSVLSAERRAEVISNSEKKIGLSERWIAELNGFKGLSDFQQAMGEKKAALSALTNEYGVGFVSLPEERKQEADYLEYAVAQSELMLEARGQAIEHITDAFLGGNSVERSLRTNLEIGEREIVPLSGEKRVDILQKLAKNTDVTLDEFVYVQDELEREKVIEAAKPEGISADHEALVRNNLSDYAKGLYAATPRVSDPQATLSDYWKEMDDVASVMDTLFEEKGIDPERMHPDYPLHKQYNQLRAEMLQRYIQSAGTIEGEKAAISSMFEEQFGERVADMKVIQDQEIAGQRNAFRKRAVSTVIRDIAGIPSADGLESYQAMKTAMEEQALRLHDKAGEMTREELQSALSEHWQEVATVYFPKDKESRGEDVAAEKAIDDMLAEKGVGASDFSSPFLKEEYTRMRGELVEAYKIQRIQRHGVPVEGEFNSADVRHVLSSEQLHNAEVLAFLPEAQRQSDLLIKEVIPRWPEDRVYDREPDESYRMFVSGYARAAVEEAEEKGFSLQSQEHREDIISSKNADLRERQIPQRGIAYDQMARKIVKDCLPPGFKVEDHRINDIIEGVIPRLRIAVHECFEQGAQHGQVMKMVKGGDPPNVKGASEYLKEAVIEPNEEIRQVKRKHLVRATRSGSFTGEVASTMKGVAEKFVGSGGKGDPFADIIAKAGDVPSPGIPRNKPRAVTMAGELPTPTEGIEPVNVSREEKQSRRKMSADDVLKHAQDARASSLGLSPSAMEKAKALGQQALEGGEGRQDGGGSPRLADHREQGSPHSSPEGKRKTGPGDADSPPDSPKAGSHRLSDASQTPRKPPGGNLRGR